MPPLGCGADAGADGGSRDQVGVQAVGGGDDGAVIGGGAGADQARAGQRDDSRGHVIVAVVVGDRAGDGVGGGRQLQGHRVIEDEARPGVGRSAIVDHRAQHRAVVVGGVDGGLDAGVLADEVFVAGNVASGRDRRRN